MVHPDVRPDDERETQIGGSGEQGPGPPTISAPENGTTVGERTLGPIVSSYPVTTGVRAYRQRDIYGSVIRFCVHPAAPSADSAPGPMLLPTSGTTRADLARSVGGCRRTVRLRVSSPESPRKGWELSAGG